jgi:hypothetical protein
MIVLCQFYWHDPQGSLSTVKCTDLALTEPMVETKKSWYGVKKKKKEKRNYVCVICVFKAYLSDFDVKL